MKKVNVFLMVVAIVFAFNVQSQNWKDIKNKTTKNVENKFYI